MLVKNLTTFCMRCLSSHTFQRRFGDNPNSDFSLPQMSKWSFRFAANRRSHGRTSLTRGHQAYYEAIHPTRRHLYLQRNQIDHDCHQRLKELTGSFCACLLSFVFLFDTCSTCFFCIPLANLKGWLGYHSFI